MCLAIPMRLVKIEGNSGIVAVNKTQRRIHLGFVKDVKIGDYLIVHAGFAIQKLDEKEARDTLDILNEIAKL
jgi:hydrogenase expression/formation protein HypC